MDVKAIERLGKDAKRATERKTYKPGKTTFSHCLNKQAKEDTIENESHASLILS